MKILQLLEKQTKAETGLYSYWDLVEHYGLDDEASEIHDAAIPWINQNNWRCISKMRKNEGLKKVARIQFFIKHVLKADNYGRKITTPEEFEAAQDADVKIWRGGGGKFDPDFKLGHPWVSFTANRERANTFSVYDGTYAMRVFELPKRDEYWIVEADIRLKDVLLYLPQGYDEEVIVDKKVLRSAKIIESKTKKAA